MKRALALQVVLPVHNEAESIGPVVAEIAGELAPRVSLEFIVCEDGSTDGTQKVLESLQERFAMNLILSAERKGYSRAVIDGFKAVRAPYALCLDSDGQCDPKDFWRFWEQRAHFDVIIGRRVKRADPWGRILLSRGFKLLYWLLFRVPVHDPSCPYVLVSKRVLDRLTTELGVLQQGFWWEFMACIHRRGFRIAELPVTHRPRLGGTTRVYKLRKLPGIGFWHVLGLFQIWWKTRT
jgi:dolichol-phosphate mannosyltransferase